MIYRIGLEICDSCDVKALRVNRMRTIYFSVGEPSGDLHAANLIEALQEQHPQLRFVGMGGPRMAAAGCELQFELTQLAVMWLLNVLMRLPTFIRLLMQADRYFRDEKPDAVVLVDYPGLNWWVARRAKARGIPVIYYGAPQLWAWAGWRVKKMARLTDHVLCKLPFEETWFRDREVNAHYVGHPYFDELATRELDQQFIQQRCEPSGPLLTLLPGSRDQEVAANLPVFLVAASKVSKQNPALRTAVACFNEEQASAAREAIRRHHGGTPEPRIEVHWGRTPELIAAADCCLACSGSVSLELMYHNKPSVIHYRIGRFAFLLQDYFRTARYITLVNLLAADRIRRLPFEPCDGRRVRPFPEFITHQDASDALAESVLERIEDGRLRQQTAVQLDEMVRQYGKRGASVRAASYIGHVLGLTDASSQPPRLKIFGTQGSDYRSKAG